MDTQEINFVYITKRQALSMHEVLIEKFGGIHGLRDEGLLESALASPRQSAFGQDIYPDLYSKASVYAFGLSENQPFLDGNKRIAVSVMATFMMINGADLTCSQVALYEVIMNMANKKLSRDSLAQWLKTNSVALKKQKSQKKKKKP